LSALRIARRTQPRDRSGPQPLLSKGRVEHPSAQDSA
jgi:hypothetical protein